MAGNDGFLYSVASDTNPNDGRLNDPSLFPYSIAAGATQSGATAVAAMAERFVATGSAAQTKPTALAAASERFVETITAAQTKSTVVAAAAERFVATVSATHPRPSVVAQTAERFSVAMTAAQSSATALASAAERFAMGISATQPPATASEALAEDYSLAITARQSGATAVAAIDSPAPVVAGGGSRASMNVPMSILYKPPRTKKKKRPVAVGIGAFQSPHEMLAEFEGRSVATAELRQSSHTARAASSVDSLNISDEEAVLLTYLLAAA